MSNSRGTRAPSHRHEVRTVQQQAWAVKNGQLLEAAEAAGFTVFVTGDRNLQFQQNLAKRKIGVVVLCGASNAREDLVPLIRAAINAIESSKPAECFALSPDSYLS